MNQSLGDQNLRTSASTSVSGNLSIAGPSTSPSPIPQTASATIVSIRAARVEIINVIEDWPKRTPTAQALADVLQNSIAKHETMLMAMQARDATTSAHLQNLHTTLREVQRAVNAEARPRKRHVVKGAVMQLLGGMQPDIFLSCQTRVIDAFQAFELNSIAAIPVENTSRPRPSTYARTTPPTPRPHGNHHPNTTLDISGRFFKLATRLRGRVPFSEPFKAVGSVGLSIVKMLDEIAENIAEAQSFATYVEGLVGTIGQFRNNRGQIGPDTTSKLKDFESVMNSVNDQLKSLRAQRGFQNAVSHARNKEILTECQTQIQRSFTQLQVHLSLNTVQFLNNLGDADARRKRRDLLDRLGNADTGATDKADNPEDLLCLEGTRVDILNQVDTWASGPSSERVLWINGVAGCGKSTVAATVANRREGLAATAIFYFTRRNQPRNKRVICSLARQLAQKVACGSDESPKHLVLSNVQANSDVASSSLSIQFKYLLADPLSKLMPGSPPTLIIIDALDEWDNTDDAVKLVHLIHQEQGKLSPSIKFIFTSRRESHLSRAFGSSQITSLVKSLALDNVSRRADDQDIRAYLTMRFERISSTSFELSKASWPGTTAIEKLVELSGGLFQWASTVVRYVEEGSHDVRLKDIFARLNQLRDLDALYQLVLSTLLQTNKRTSTPTLLQHILGAIVVAPTPISLDTLAYLYASSLESIHDTTSDIKEILAALGPLLIVPARSNKPIRVLHPSIIDFLSDPLRCTDIRIGASRSSQNRRIALLCLQRMLRDLKRDICGVNDPTKLNVDPDVQKLVSNHIPNPLRYACRYWAEHLSASGVENWVEVDEPLRQFCTGYLLFWFEVVGLTDMIQPAVAAIKQAKAWLSLCPPSSKDSLVQRLLHDAWRFLLIYSEPISINAAHIYLSALSTAPTETGFMRSYQAYATKVPRVLAGPIAKRWPSSLWVAAQHTGYVSCLAFSPSGGTIASGSYDETLRLWDAGAGVQKEPTLKGHAGIVSCLAFSSDGRTVASGSHDKTLRLCDVETGVQKGPTLEGHGDHVLCLAFSPDSRVVASGSRDKTLRMWDAEDGVQKGPALEGHTGYVLCVSFSSDGRTIASGSDDSTLRLWDVGTGMQKGPTLEGHINWVSCLDFSPDGRTIASGSDDKTLRLWDVEAGAQMGPTLEGHTGWICCLKFSSNGRTVASGSDDNTLRLWDVESGAQRGLALGGHTSHVRCLAFSSDGTTLASGSDDKTMRLWNVETGLQKGRTLEGHTGYVRCLAFSPDGTTIVSGSDDGTLHLWGVETGVDQGGDVEIPKQLALEGHTKHVTCLAFSSDGITVASGSGDHTLCLWDVETGLQKGPACKGHIGWVCCLAFSSDGKTVASGSDDRTLRVWEVETGEQKGNALEISSVPSRLEFSADGGSIAVATSDGAISQLDLHTRTSLFPSPNQQAFSPRLTSKEIPVLLGSDGWVTYGNLLWFWLPTAFGREVEGELRGNRFVFCHGCHVCIIDVSEIMYLVN